MRTKRTRQRRIKTLEPVQAVCIVILVSLQTFAFYLPPFGVLCGSLCQYVVYAFPPEYILVWKKKNTIETMHFPVTQVHSNDGQTEVGKISKQWSGLVREYFTDADNFGVSCKSLVHFYFEL